MKPPKRKKRERIWAATLLDDNPEVRPHYLEAIRERIREVRWKLDIPGLGPAGVDFLLRNLLRIDVEHGVFVLFPRVPGQDLKWRDRI